MSTKTRPQIYSNSVFEELLDSASSTGSYETLYAYTSSTQLMRKLIKSYSVCEEKIVLLINNFYDLLEIYGYERGKTDLEKFRHFKAYDKLNWSFNCYVWIFGENSWVELVKWKISSFFAAIFNACNIPRRPRECEVFKNPLKLFYGRAYRYFLKMDNKTKRLFANDVLMLKKGAPAVSKALILEKKIEVYKQLTTEPPQFYEEQNNMWVTKVEERFKVEYLMEIPNVQSDDIKSFDCYSHVATRDVVYSQKRLVHFVDKVVKELFTDRKLSEDYLTSYAFPSLSANYNNSRREGGGLGEIQAHIADIYDDVITDFLGENLHGFDFFGPIISDFILNPENLNIANNIIQRPCKFGDDLEEWEEHVRYTSNRFTTSCDFFDFYFLYDDSKLRTVYKFILLQLLKRAMDEEPLTETVGLPEPLKVRVITKGPPVTYFVLKRIQKFLWTTLKNHPTFRLIGEPLTEEIVNSLFPDMQSWEKVLSGDYKASTDNIYSWLSDYTNKKVFEELRRADPDNYLLNHFEVLTQRALTGHIIINPEWKHYGMEEAPLINAHHAKMVYEDFQVNDKINKKSKNYKPSTLRMENPYDFKSKVIGKRANGEVVDPALQHHPEEVYLQFPYSYQHCVDLMEGASPYPKGMPAFMRDLIERDAKDFLKQMEDKGCVKQKEQKQGQLMGSVVSFPFLCIINCAVCWYAMSCDDPSNEFKKLKSLKLLINGDDCVFTGTRFLMQHWEKCIAYVGFSSSVGKTYFSDELLVMNSMTFLWEDGVWNLKKYINFGLLRAVNKAGEQQKNIFALKSIQNDLINKTPEHHLKKVMKMFFRNHTEKFKAAKLPYYMPQWAGGLGLIPQDDHNTYMDRKILCSRIKSGEEFREPPKQSEWRIDRHIRKLIGEYLPLCESFHDKMIVDGEVLDLEEKSYYNALLALTLVSSCTLDYYVSEENFEKGIEQYILSMRKRWLTPVSEHVKVRTLEKLNERYEQKKHITLQVV